MDISYILSPALPLSCHMVLRPAQCLVGLLSIRTRVMTSDYV